MGCSRVQDGLRKAHGRALGLTELGALLELPERFNLACGDASKSRKIGRVSGTILTLSGAAYHVHDECLQARIKLTWANNDYCRELGEGSQKFRVARHD